MANQKDFISFEDFSENELATIIENAVALKAKPYQPILENKQLVMVFEKNSTRTRLSFEIGMQQLGGNSVFLSSEHSQLGRGEIIEDTAKVISRYADIVMIRANKHEDVIKFAKNADIPIINGLTDYNHPCQILADIMTYNEHRGPIKDKKVTWIGDGNNVCTSWVEASAKFGFSLYIAVPEQYGVNKKALKLAQEKGAQIILTDDLCFACKDSDLITTDTWVSMGDKDYDDRMEALAPFQVTESLMSMAKPDALFMHCLPAHRGEEAESSVIDGPQSVIFDEAENRLHVQKAIMSYLLT
ncbi:MAG: ornithine carbamoyltransferase [Rickettsiales bacterium]|nr:ornithine carbamoyltransferase [Rickettsiales bacterium]